VMDHAENEESTLTKEELEGKIPQASMIPSMSVRDECNTFAINPSATDHVVNHLE